MTKPTASHSETVGTEALEWATGRSRDAWNDLLDSAGAREWDHTTIAAWLVDERGVDGWWAQGITVGFEQHIGRRQPGQRADGTFEASVSRTYTAPRDAVVTALVTAVTAAAGCEPASVNTTAKNASARWKLPNGRTVVTGIYPSGEKTRASLTMPKLGSADELAEAKALLKSWLPAQSDVSG
ncbi:hypothetical protein [Paramicrobacterium agarici]|uniref:hypothetical protein n=1 Tax=Paramicrobacterium agarici TaxID=630514 RepID=UPI00115074DA|nr:hypothetical protein [Microbacterium agarici]TQO21724.1 hypothetical protein FB385_0535 [Microbacterium agarici]